MTTHSQGDIMETPTQSALDSCGGDRDQAELLMDLCRDAADGNLIPGQYFVNGHGKPSLLCHINSDGTFRVIE